jgi:hypothetical protein
MESAHHDQKGTSPVQTTARSRSTFKRSGNQRAPRRRPRGGDVGSAKRSDGGRPHRQLSLFPGVKRRPQRKYRDQRGPTARVKITRVLERHQREHDGSVQISHSQIAEFAEVALKTVRRVMRILGEEGWFAIVGVAKRGVATVYEILKGWRKCGPRLAKVRGTNAGSSCIPHTPLCTSSTSSLNNTPSLRVPEQHEGVVVEIVQRVETETGLARPVAESLVREHGSAAVTAKLSLLQGAMKWVRNPAGWFRAALKANYSPGRKPRPAPPPPEELARRMAKAHAQARALKADEEERLRRLEAGPAPATVPRPIAMVRENFRRVEGNDSAAKKAAFFKAMNGPGPGAAELKAAFFRALRGGAL